MQAGSGSPTSYGWATYHYGRWYEDSELGWSWVPGDTWGPSWVSFQEGNDYVGWAPLPPGVNVGVGFSGGGYAYGIAPAAYLFVPERDFLAPRLGGYCPQATGTAGRLSQRRDRGDPPILRRHLPSRRLNPESNQNRT